VLLLLGAGWLWDDESVECPVVRGRRRFDRGIDGTPQAAWGGLQVARSPSLVSNNFLLIVPR
jgi:hypothetical protein